MVPMEGGNFLNFNGKSCRKSLGKMWVTGGGLQGGSPAPLVSGKTHFFFFFSYGVWCEVMKGLTDGRCAIIRY